MEGKNRGAEAHTRAAAACSKLMIPEIIGIPAIKTSKSIAELGNVERWILQGYLATVHGTRLISLSAGGEFWLMLRGDQRWIVSSSFTIAELINDARIMERLASNVVPIP